MGGYEFDLSKAVSPKETEYTPGQQDVLAKIASFYPPEKVSVLLKTGDRTDLPSPRGLREQAGGPGLNFIAMREFGSLASAMDAYRPGLYELVARHGIRYFSANPAKRRKEMASLEQTIGTYIKIVHEAGIPLYTERLRNASDWRLKVIYSTLKRLHRLKGDKRTPRFRFEREAHRVSGLPQRIFRAFEDNEKVDWGSLGEVFVRYLLNAALYTGVSEEPAFQKLFIPDLQFVRPSNGDSHPSIYTKDDKILYADARINDALVEVKSGNFRAGQLLKTEWAPKFRLEERLKQETPQLFWGEDNRPVSDICFVILNPHVIDDAVARKLSKAYDVHYARESDLIPFFEATDKDLGQTQGFEPIQPRFQQFLEQLSHLQAYTRIELKHLLTDYIEAIQIDTSFDPDLFEEDPQLDLPIDMRDMPF